MWLYCCVLRENVLAHTRLHRATCACLQCPLTLRGILLPCIASIQPSMPFLRPKTPYIEDFSTMKRLVAYSAQATAICSLCRSHDDCIDPTHHSSEYSRDSLNMQTDTVRTAWRTASRRDDYPKLIPPLRDRLPSATQPRTPPSPRASHVRCLKTGGYHASLESFPCRSANRRHEVLTARAPGRTKGWTSPQEILP